MDTVELICGLLIGPYPTEGVPGRHGEPRDELMTEKGEPMLLMGLLTPALVMGGREVMEAAAEGTRGGERCPEGGEDTDELSGLRESLLSPMMVAGTQGLPDNLTPKFLRLKQPVVKL